MLTISKGMVWVGAINIIAMFEMYMEVGFTAMWWEVLWAVSGVYAAITGFGAYRFRETRSMTLAEYLEKRYDKKIRIISGIFSWLIGVLTFGLLFPAIGARFFIFFLDIPAYFSILNMTLETFPVMMIGLMLISLLFVWFGGHIAILITDFMQGAYTHIASIAILSVLFITVFNWEHITDVLNLAPVNESLVNPLDTSKSEFNIGYFLIGIFARWYNVLSYSAEQTYVSSSKSAHEFKISSLLHYWRWLSLCIFFMVLVLIVKMYLFHPAYAEYANVINGSLSTIGDEVIRKQQTVTMALKYILPQGFRGMFCAIMLVALISTYDSFLHTFGAVFIQDIVMPFRKTPFSCIRDVFTETVVPT